MRPQLILTDLDGTLLGPDYRPDKLVPILEQLNLLGIPVIPVTSKTLGELLLLSKRAPLGRVGDKVLYVAELGGAIYATKGLLNTSITPQPVFAEELYEYPLAEPIARLRRKIDETVKDARCMERVIVVSREDPSELHKVLGLPSEQAEQARERRYDEVLIPESRACAKELVRQARKKGLDVVSGGLHVHVGKGIGKERALRVLDNALRHVTRNSLSAISFCLGDSPIDWGFVEYCSLGGIVPRRRGSKQVSTPRVRYVTAPFPAPRGWSWLVERYVLARSPP